MDESKQMTPSPPKTCEEIAKEIVEDFCFEEQRKDCAKTIAKALREYAKTCVEKALNEVDVMAEPLIKKAFEEGRRAALEEAAKVAEVYVGTWTPGRWFPDQSEDRLRLAKETGERIRALLGRDR